MKVSKEDLKDCKNLEGRVVKGDFRLKKKLKARWLLALRGGEYLHGSHRLRNLESNRYCCLGVLCQEMGRLDDGGAYRHKGKGKGSTSLIMERGIHAVLPWRVQTKLINMNDIQGRSFEEIASWINRYL